MTDQTVLHEMRSFYESGATKSYSFRIEQLKKFRDLVIRHENDISRALYEDLKKSPEETFATETGLLLAELNVAIKKLKKWMRPKATSVNIANLPSSAYTISEPLGVVLIIGAWNYPFQLSLIPLVGAIAAGNCAVVKPSELAPATAAIIEKILLSIFPVNYVVAVQGEGAVIVPAMMNEFRFDHIFYTGSMQVGRSIYELAAKNLSTVTLELGGKSPAVIEADADIKVAARRIALGKFLNSGQTCVAPDYLLVHHSVKEHLIKEIKNTIEAFYSSDPKNSYSFTRIINKRRFEKLISYLGEGTILLGGEHDASGLFIAPTIMENVDQESPLMKEEIFGPILPVFSFNNREEAVAIIQKNPDPLGFYLFTSSKSAEKDWIERISFGGGCINNTGWQFANHHLPFGGIRTSGIGAYHGKFSFDVFSHTKSILKTPTWFDPAIRYPPFNGKLKWYKLLIR